MLPVSLTWKASLLQEGYRLDEEGSCSAAAPQDSHCTFQQMSMAGVCECSAAEETVLTAPMCFARGGATVETDVEPAVDLVFATDQSGSMDSHNRRNPHDHCWESGLHSSKSASKNRADRGS